MTYKIGQNLVFSVRDTPFNAKGDGVTDDTTAIQNAVNTGGSVLFPIGTYKVSSQITVPSLTLFGTIGSLIMSTIASGLTDFGVLQHVPSTIFSGALTADVTPGVNPTLSAVTQIGSGPTITLTGVPNGPASWVVKITTAGALNAGFFEVSDNGGSSYGSPVLLPSSGRYLIPGTSIIVLFAAGSYVLNTTYAWTSSVQTVLLNWAPTVGNTLGITRADTNQYYQIIAVVSAGGGNFTVSVDRPFFIKWQSGDGATEYLPTQAPVYNNFNGNGLTFTGTGSHAILMSGVWNATYSDILVNPSSGIFSVAGIGFDGCMNITLERCVTDLTGSGNATGQYLEGCERGIIRGGVARGGFYGFECSDSFESGLESCWAYGGLTGFNLITLNAAGVNYGGIDCWVKGGGAIGSQVGMIVQGQTRLTVSDWHATYCNAQGILVQPGPGGVPTIGNMFVGCATTYCTRGVWVQSGCVDTRITRLDVTGCGSDAGVWADDSLTITGLVADPISAGYCINATAGKHLYTDLKITYGATTAVAIVLAGSLHRVRDAYIDMTGTTTSVGVICGAGVTYLDNVTVVNAEVGLQVLSGATVYLGINCDFSSCTYPIQVLSGGTLVAEQAGILEVPCAAGGNIDLTIPQAFVQVIEATGVLPSNTNIILPQMVNEAVPGLTYDLANKTTGAYFLTFSVAGGTGFTVAAGQRAHGYIDTSGNLVSITGAGEISGAGPSIAITGNTTSVLFTGPGSLTDVTGGSNGQILSITIQQIGAAVTRSGSSGSGFQLSGLQNCTALNAYTQLLVKFVSAAGYWQEIARSTQNG